MRMWVTDAQVKKLRKELDKDPNLSRAAMKAGMDRKTARRYRDLAQLPSEAQLTERTWKTRPDPFEADWPELELRLAEAPGLEAKTLFDDLVLRKPGVYEPGQLRTLQRKVKKWRALHGPDKIVFFAQEHRPGEAMQTDFTNCDELGITIAGEPFPHLLCHNVLPYSNWEWASICHSESIASLRNGVQGAFIELGGLTVWHQTDNSTAATHHTGNGQRVFNADYLRLMEHLGLLPRTTAIGQKEQNGDVEALNGAFKRRLEQHLLLRGSRDFDSRAHYRAFLHDLLRKTNTTRGQRLLDERKTLKPLPQSWWPEYEEQDVRVTDWSTIRCAHNTYSVPSRLIGERVRLRLYDDRIEVFYDGRNQLTLERLRGRHGHRIDYRHVIWSLIRKPAAFARYRYREDLFPELVFRRAYDDLLKRCTERKADLEYVRILHLAASTTQQEVATALELALASPVPLDADLVRTLVKSDPPAPPAITIGQPEVASYDRLLQAVSK
jgi:hypothetical protein